MATTTPTKSAAKPAKAAKPAAPPPAAAAATAAATPAKTGTPPAADVRGRKRALIGRVASAKMQKTVVVEVVRSVRHPVYGKYVRLRKKYKAHDENGTYKAGDLVEIREHRPLSREKRWTVTRLIERPVD